MTRWFHQFIGLFPKSVNKKCLRPDSMTTSINIHQNIILTVEPGMKSITLGYRQDIDGLRAVAVLLVMLYHIFGSIFSGGFVGVDIFFVISGYLITDHIVLGLKSDSFSFKEFYVRRMRRILPVFIFVLFVVNLVGFFVFNPSELTLLAQSSISSMLSISNLYFWKFVSLGYFHADASVIPLLHTWSLGVEEQFYVVWPITLFFLFRGLNQWTALDKQKVNLLLILIIVLSTLISFFGYSYFRKHESLVFYLPITRAFEFLLGAGLVIYETKIPNPTAIRSFFISILGAALIVYGASFRAADYPSHYILLPCIGTVLLIYSGKINCININKILSLNFMTFLGLISYSLYLWHWPIIAYANYLGIEMDATVGLGIILISIILSFLSWRYIEQPFRNKYKLGLKYSALFFFLIPTILVGGFYIFCTTTPNVGFNKISFIALKAINDFSGPFTEGKCIDSPSFYPASEQQCSIGHLTQSKPDVLIVGDSHAMAAAGMLNVLLDEVHLKGYLVTQSGSPYFSGMIQNWKINTSMQRSSALTKMINKNHYAYVVLGGYWSYYPDYMLRGKHYSEKTYVELEKGLNDSIETIMHAGSIPVIIFDVPPLFRVPMSCGFMHFTLSQCYNSLDKVMRAQASTRSLILRLKEKYPSIRLIDPSLVICQNEQCPSALNGHPLYHSNGDNSHLNYSGSTLIGEIYSKKIQNPFT